MMSSFAIVCLVNNLLFNISNNWKSWRYIIKKQVSLNKSSKILSRIKYNHSRITVSCLLMFTFGAKRNCWYCIFYIFLEAPWSLYYVFSARKVVLCLYNILMVPFSHYQFAQTNSMSYFSLLVSKCGLFDMPLLLIKK